MAQPTEVELTLTLRAPQLREARLGRKLDLLAQAKEFAPSARLVSGNVNYSVTVAVTREHAAKLEASLEKICVVAPRHFVRQFGDATAIGERPSDPKSGTR
jgi:hypothetical protein